MGGANPGTRRTRGTRGRCLRPFGSASRVGRIVPVVTVGAVSILAFVPSLGPVAAADGWRYARAVDGDTIQFGNGRYVRLLGYDSPEIGECGYSQATAKMADLLRGGVRLENRSDRDRYGRVLAYVTTNEGWDVGTAMLRSGLAIARYDSRDGYDWHPKERKYHRLDASNGRITCKKYPTKTRPTKTPDKSATYFPNCDAARKAGAAPVYRGDAGYGRHLDRDGDGVGCE